MMYVFPQVVTYTCNEGYSTDEKPDGVKTFEIECTDTGLNY